MDKLDADIREAMQALEATVPESYFDQFEARLEARLEVEAMAGTDMLDQGVGMDDRPSAASPEKTEENTGLHDIKALARSQKRRISKRMTTESEVEQSLLASSSALSAVALPEPGKDKPTFETDIDRARAKKTAKATTSASASAAATTGTERSDDSRGLPVWIYAAVGLVAAAAVVFFVVRGGKSDTSDNRPVALEDTAAGDKAADGEGAAGAPPTKSLSSPSEPSGAGMGAGVEPDDGDGADGDDSALDGDDPTLVADADGTDTADDDTSGRSALKRDDDRDSKTDRDKKKTDKKADDKKSDTKKSDDKTKDEIKKDDTKSAGGGGGTSDEPDDKKNDGEPSLDDLLNNASGGSLDTGGDKTDDSATPTKKKLSSSDIKRGMNGIMGSVKSCYDGEPGTVKIKFSVDPSGKVTKAYPTGKFQGTKAGDCVANLVMGVTFPAFDGRTSSFSFPFLLTQ